MNFRDTVFSQFLEEDETITRGFRRHFPLQKIIFWTLISIGGVLFLRWFFFCSLKKAFCPLGTESVYLFVTGGVFWVSKIFNIWLKWYGNGVFMTSESLLFIYWDKLFEPKSVRLDYWDLDEIEIVRKGLKSYLGGYADVHFNKVSGGKPIVIKNVHRPHYMEQVISKNKEIMTNERNFTEESALKDLLASLAVRHVEENGQPTRNPESDKQPTPPTPTHPLTPEQKTWLEQTQTAQDIEIQPKHHFKNHLVEVEKQLDDDGGIEIDL
ncbi:hypothetical protein CSB37_02725 [bacterium DOLZORAL124_38_8]|nr:MAG: hypothetical protein CSB37_02725 [bacterium DOLZORAL124_38_8]